MLTYQPMGFTDLYSCSGLYRYLFSNMYSESHTSKWFIFCLLSHFKFKFQAH